MEGEKSSARSSDKGHQRATGGGIHAKVESPRKKRRKYEGRVGCLGQGETGGCCGHMESALAWRPTAGNKKAAPRDPIHNASHLTVVFSSTRASKYTHEHDTFIIWSFERVNDGTTADF
jgi:hypothetical protein